MDKTLKLEEGYLDDNLRPLKIDGEQTSLEISKSGARISGGLEVNGDGKPIVAQPLITNAINHTEPLEIRALGGNDHILFDTQTFIRMHEVVTDHYTVEFNTQGSGSAGASMKFTSVLDDGDYSILETTTNGVTSLTTVDDDGEDADLTFTIDGDTIIDRNTALTATGTAKGLHIDYDHTGISASGQTVTGIGLDLDMNCNSVIHVGAVNQTGIDIDMVAATNFFESNTGIDITTSGADLQYGLKINNENTTATNGTEADFINYSSADTDDFFMINTIANGETLLKTHDATASAADLKLDVDGRLTLDAKGYIDIDSDGGFIYIKHGGTGFGYFRTNTASTLQLVANTNYSLSLEALGTGSIVLDSGTGITKFYDAADATEYASITVVGGTGGTTIATASEAADGHLELAPDGKMILNSVSGGFEMHGGGSTAKFADMYAGMILGSTHVFGSGSGGVFQSVTTAWESLLWDTDKYALVTFVVPPSNRVKISVFLPYVQLSGNILQLGLATDSSATTLNTKYQNNVWDVDETDTVAINYSWVVEGSDHSWSAGDTETLYIMAYADAVIRMYTGGTSGDKFGGVIVEAVALPATIGDGSEP